MSWFDLTSSRLQQLGLWTSFLRLPLFSSWNVPSQPETFGRSDAETIRKMLRLLRRRRLRFSVIIVRVDFSLFFPLFFGMFCFRPGRDDVSFWAPWAEVPQDWEVNTIKYPRSLVYLKFGEAKLEIWLNNCWKVRVKLEHQSLFQWNYSNRLFGMVSSTLHVYTITSVVNLCEEKLPLSLYSIL